MTSVVEILFAPATQAYRDDLSKIDPVLEYVSAAKGSVG